MNFSLSQLGQRVYDFKDDLTGEKNFRLYVEDIARGIGNKYFRGDSESIQQAVTVVNEVLERTAQDSDKVAEYLFNSFVRLFPDIHKKYEFVMPS